MLELQKDEKIAAFLPVREFNDEQFILMATKKGLVKKTNLSLYSRPRRNGINAIKIVEGDTLITAELTSGDVAGQQEELYQQMLREAVARDATTMDEAEVEQLTDEDVVM